MSRFFCVTLRRKIENMKRLADILYKVDRTIRPILEITTIIALILLVAASFDSPIKRFFTYCLYAAAIVWVVALACRLILSPFVKSEEEEIFEQQVDYILQKKQESKPVVAYTPLRDVTQEQEINIIQLLRTLPEHPEKPGHINLALVAQYLTALEKLSKADLKDKRQLRNWVAEITNKQVPSSSQFNEAIPSKAATKVAAARKELESLFR